MAREVANVETMMSVRHAPWHGLGTVVEDAPTSADAIRLAGLDWDVVQKPVYCHGMLVPRRRGNVREKIDPDTGLVERSVLGIVSDTYNIVQNREAFDFFDALIGEEARYETAGAIDEGRRIFLTAKMEQRWTVADDVVDTFLLLTNGHDGGHALRAAITPIRVVCQNTLNIALRNHRRSWTMWHSKDIKAKLDEARHTLVLTAAYMDGFVEFGNRAADTKVSAGVLESLTDELFKPFNDSSVAKKNAAERKSVFESCLRAPDLKAYQGTMWGVLNAVSDFETHAARKQTAVMRKVMNDRLPLFNKAFDFLTTQAN